MNKNNNVQDGYTLEQVKELKPLKAQIIEFLVIMHENCKKDPKYSVNLTKKLRRDFKLSAAAASYIVAKAVKIGLMYRLGPKNYYARFTKDRAIPNEKMLDNLCKKRYIKVQAHKSIEVPDGFEIEVAKNDYSNVGVIYPDNDTKNDQDLVTTFVHSDIYKALKAQSFDIKLSKVISYNI